MSNLRIGFIGLGSMGGDQARCLAANDFNLTVYDVHAPAAEAFKNQANIAQSVAEVAQNADIVGICVRDDQQVKDTLQGADGLLAHLKAGAVVLIHSTVKPETIRELAREAEGQDIDIVDAPVSRTRHKPGGPFVAVMMGGNQTTLERVRPVLDAYATDVFEAGALGAGVAMKIVNNMVTWTNIVTFVQAVRLAEASGVNLDGLMALMESNGNLTKTLKAFSQGFLTGSSDPELMESQAGIGEKDLQLAADLAKEMGVTIPVAEQSKAYVRKAMVGDDS